MGKKCFKSPDVFCQECLIGLTRSENGGAEFCLSLCGELTSESTMAGLDESEVGEKVFS